MALGAPQDGHVQVAVDGVGKKIDNAELTRDDGTVVERQRAVIASDENPRIQANVSGEPGRGALHTEVRSQNEVLEVLLEIRDMLKLLLSS